MPIYYDEKQKTYFVQTGYTDKFGKRKYIKKRGFKRKKDAQIYERERLQEIERMLEEGLTGDKLPFSTLADDYLSWYKARRKESSYTAAYNHIERHLKPYFGDVDVHSIENIDIRRFQDSKLTEGLSGAYLNKMHIFLSAVLSHGEKYFGLRRNAAKVVGNFGVEKKKHVDYWTLEEFNQFISVVEDIRHRAFFMLLFYSGARKGEIRALTWEDVDLEKGTISISKTDYNGKVTAPKTKSSERVVFLPQRAVESMKEYSEYYKSSEHYKPVYVVFGAFKDSVSDSTIDRWYERYFEQSGLTHRIRIHDFRHSHASHLINLGAIPTVVAQRLGHADVSMVLNTYGHLYPSTQSSIVDMLDREQEQIDTNDSKTIP